MGKDRHSGNAADSGHYISFTDSDTSDVNSEATAWHEFNDQDVTTFNPADTRNEINAWWFGGTKANNEHPYILICRRCTPQPSNDLSLFTDNATTQDKPVELSERPEDESAAEEDWFGYDHQQSMHTKQHTNTNRVSGLLDNITDDRHFPCVG
jgi:hypothetical protein